ncbi:ribonuclease H-like domain-containing protein, partial [Tanacetum coccineum]
YLTLTRPDLSYAVQHVCLFMHGPRDSHFTALKRILCYVRGTLDYGLQLHVTLSCSSVEAEYRGVANVVAETAWIRNLLCELHTLLFTATLVYYDNVSVVYMFANPVQLSRSSAEAEYRGVTNVVAETALIRNLLFELHTLLFTATLVYCDNVSAIYMPANWVQHQHTKHIEIDIHFVCDFVALGQVRVLHVPSRFYYADIFTNGLPTSLFIEFRSSLNIRRSPAHTEEEY